MAELMYLTVKQQVKHLPKESFASLRELSRAAKNLTNEAIYSIRQYYFATKGYLRYEENYKVLKSSPNYRCLNSNMAQQILKEVDGSFRSFFGLLSLAGKGKYSYADIKLPHYLPKDGHATLIIGMVRLNGRKLLIPYSNSFRKTHKDIEIMIPPILLDKKIREIRIIPRSHARFFEIQYTYEAERIDRNLNRENALALDPGVDNLLTAVTNTGKSFLIDGRRLKSVNQWYNKENARFRCIRDRQYPDRKKTTKRQQALLRKRNDRVNDILSKAARKVIDYCIENDIGTLVLGCNKDFQRNSDMGKVQNQTFVNIPYGRLADKLKYLCKRNSIRFFEQEESYTSKASFWDGDPIPVYGEPGAEAGEKEVTFSGTRIRRGLYRTKDGRILNADINGALNILRKSNVVSLEALYSRGEVDTPVRIRIA